MPDLPKLTVEGVDYEVLEIREPRNGDLTLTNMLRVNENRGFFGCDRPILRLPATPEPSVSGSGSGGIERRGSFSAFNRASGNKLDANVLIDKACSVINVPASGDFLHILRDDLAEALEPFTQEKAAPERFHIPDAWPSGVHERGMWLFNCDGPDDAKLAVATLNDLASIAQEGAR